MERNKILSKNEIHQLTDRNHVDGTYWHMALHDVNRVLGLNEDGKSAEELGDALTPMERACYLTYYYALHKNSGIMLWEWDKETQQAVLFLYGTCYMVLLYMEKANAFRMVWESCGITDDVGQFELQERIRDETGKWDQDYPVWLEKCPEGRKGYEVKSVVSVVTSGDPYEFAASVVLNLSALEESMDQKVGRLLMRYQKDYYDGGSSIR